MSACYRTANNKFFQAPPRMADGRHFTDYRQNYALNNNVSTDNSIDTSYDYRMFLTRNAGKIIDLNKKHSYLNNTLHYSISGFETSYGVGVNNSGDIFIPDFKLGYIFKIKKNLKDISVLDLKNEKLEPLTFYNKFIYLTILKKIIKKPGNFNRIHDIYFDQQDNMHVIDMGIGNNKCHEFY